MPAAPPPARRGRRGSGRGSPRAHDRGAVGGGVDHGRDMGRRPGSVHRDQRGRRRRGPRRAGHCRCGPRRRSPSPRRRCRASRSACGEVGVEQQHRRVPVPTISTSIAVGLVEDPAPATRGRCPAGRLPAVDAARQAEQRAAMRHAGEAEAAVAVGVDRRAAGKMGGADVDARHATGQASAGSAASRCPRPSTVARPELEVDQQRRGDEDRRIGADRRCRRSSPATKERITAPPKMKSATSAISVVSEVDHGARQRLVDRAVDQLGAAASSCIFAAFSRIRS